MTKLINNPAPAVQPQPEVRDRWLDADTVYVELTDGRTFTVDMEDLAPSDYIRVRGLSFVCEDVDSYRPWKTHPYDLAFIDYYNESITDNDLLFELGLVARFYVRNEAGRFVTVYATDAAAAAYLARLDLGDGMLCVNAPTVKNKNLVSV